MAPLIENTSQTLLAQVAQGDNSAWRRFFDTYKVLVYLRGRAWHLCDADIEDLLIKVMEKYSSPQGRGGYAPSRGRFRDYFGRIVRNAAIDMLRQRNSRREVFFNDQEGNGAERLPDDSVDRGDSFKRDWQARIYAQAYARVKEQVPVRALQCWSAVRMEGVPAAKVARFQGVSLATVYNDCNLVWDRLKALVAELSANEDCPQ